MVDCCSPEFSLWVKHKTVTERYSLSVQKLDLFHNLPEDRTKLNVTCFLSSRLSEGQHNLYTILYSWWWWAVQNYSVSPKNPPREPDIFHFFHKRLRICNRFFTHLLYIPMYARLQICTQLSPILTKLCHIKHDYQVHIICAKCPKRTKTRAFRRLHKSLIDLLIVVCGKSL